MTSRFRVPASVENLLLGQLSRGRRMTWLGILLLLILLVPGVDYHVGRNSFHLNLYPFPVILSIFLFGHVGLISILVALGLYHLVQMEFGLEPHTVLVNNLAQLGLTLIVGLLCSWLVQTYRDLYAEKAVQATTKNELLMNLTHELRSPLFAVRGIVRNLSRNISSLSEEEVQEQLNEAQAAIASINRDVQGLSQVFRADLHELEPRPVSVACSDVIDDVLKRHPPEFHPDHRIVVEKDNDPVVCCDPLLTHQVLDNLLSNALRYSQGGTVTIKVREKDDSVAFMVQDEGPGIPVEDRERIFDRFDRGSRLSGSGFGVGLYLVGLYCDIQGGAVEVVEVEKGACFQVSLPKGECS